MGNIPFGGNSLSNELLSARVIPFLLIIILPLGIGTLLPYFFPFFQFKSPFEFQDIVMNNNFNSILVNVLRMYATMFPIIFIFIFIFQWHYKLHSRNYFEIRGYETAINEYDYINKLVFTDVLMIIILTLLFYMLPESIKKGHLQLLLGNGFFFLQSTLIISVYTMFVGLSKSYSRKDFRFQFAKVCIDTLEKKEDEVNKIYYLTKGLNSYNKFLKRNLKLQFDDTMVCSKIISSSNKNQSLNLLSASFKDNDKLKPVSCLSTIIKLPDTEQLLVKEKLEVKIKDLITVLAAIIPVMISILQLSFPLYFQSLGNK
jgi:hypothetical protein